MKIIAFVPHQYSPTHDYWQRDLGLVVRGFRSIGVEAWFAAFGESKDVDPERPVLVMTREEAADPAWWQRQQADAIILNTWLAPRYHAIRMAALSTKKPLIEKLDTDGVKSPRIWFVHHLRRNLAWCNHSDSPAKRTKSFLRAVLLATGFRLFPGLMDAKMVRCMSSVPVYGAETPLAAARVRRFLRIFHADPMPRVVPIPHPADEEHMDFREGDRKENVVVSVGRWDDVVKGWPLLLDIAQRFLGIRPDWKMVVIGSTPKLSARQKKIVDALEGRLVLTGKLDHARLSEWNRKAKIYLLTSHSETFNIAGTEALCCGCSVVGPAQIPSSAYFASRQSGTPSYLRTPDHMTDALDAEVGEWERGNRDPIAISSAFKMELSAAGVARRYLKVFSEMGSGPARAGQGKQEDI